MKVAGGAPGIPLHVIDEPRCLGLLFWDEEQLAPVLSGHQAISGHLEVGGDGRQGLPRCCGIGPGTCAKVKQVSKGGRAQNKTWPAASPICSTGPRSPLPADVQHSLALDNALIVREKINLAGGGYKC